MFRSTLAVSAVGFLALLAAPRAARADDILRLGGVDAPTMTLGFDGNVGTELVRGRYYGGFRGGVGFYGGGFYRPSYASYGRSFYRPGFAHYRPYYAPRAFYGSSFYFGAYSYPRYAYSYPSSYYSYPSYYYSYPSYSYSYYPSSYYYGNYLCPISYTVAPPMAYATLGTVPQYSTPQYTVPQYGGEVTTPVPSQSNPIPLMPPAKDGSYPYDGGPTNPVPMPYGKSPPLLKAQPSPSILVAYPPQQPATFGYPAYGEDTRATGFATNAQTPTKPTSFGTGGR